jgi:hypothetical protein
MPGRDPGSGRKRPRSEAGHDEVVVEGHDTPATLRRHDGEADRIRIGDALVALASMAASAADAARMPA